MHVYNKMVICLWIIISLTLEPLEKVAQGLFIQIHSVRKDDVKAVWFFFFFIKKANMVLMKSPAVLKYEVLYLCSEKNYVQDTRI